MGKRQLRVATALAAVAAPLCAAHASAAPPAPPPVVYTDPAGDAGAAADITTVTVSNDPYAEYTFRVDLAAAYPSGSRLYLFLDADNNAGTGDPNWAGADYIVAWDEVTDTQGISIWTDGAWQASTLFLGDGFRLAPDRLSVTLRLSGSAFGRPASFTFFLSAQAGDGATFSHDDAPNSQGWRYTFEQPLSLSFATPTTSVVQKRKRVWTLTAPVVRADTGRYLAQGTVVCKGKAGRARLAVIHHQIASQGPGKPPVAVCEFRIPKKHARLTASMSVTYGGAGVIEDFAG